MEIITSDAPAPYHFLIAAITVAWPKMGDLPSNIQGEDLQVEFKVNGHTLPFKAVIEDVYRRINEQLDGEALDKARSLVEASGLEPVRQALERAEWEIIDALQTALARGPK